MKSFFVYLIPIPRMIYDHLITLGYPNSRPPMGAGAAGVAPGMGAPFLRSWSGSHWDNLKSMASLALEILSSRKSSNHGANRVIKHHKIVTRMVDSVRPCSEATLKVSKTWVADPPSHRFSQGYSPRICESGQGQRWHQLHGWLPPVTDLAMSYCFVAIKGDQRRSLLDPTGSPRTFARWPWPIKADSSKRWLNYVTRVYKNPLSFQPLLQAGAPEDQLEPGLS